MTRKPRQEQEPASEEIVEVAPGVLRLQIPINFTGLGHVNAYACIDGSGAAVVDVGLPGKETWVAVRRRLHAAGLKVSDVRSVLVTHSHPDHFGSAGRLAHAAGASLVTHERFHTWLEPAGTHGQGNHLHAGVADSADAGLGTEEVESDEDVEEDDTGYFAALASRRTPWGGKPFPQSRRQRAERALARHNLLPSMRPPIPTERIADGDTVYLAGRPWRAVHTPGHTSDHLCLYDPETETLLSGDHLLPTITPHIGGLSPLVDPLGSFLHSLAKLTKVGPVSTVLPAHGHPFSTMAERVDAIVDHHDERLIELRSFMTSDTTMTVVELSQQLFRKALWGMMAESETFAHLEFLRHRGAVEQLRLFDGQLGYRLSGNGAVAASARSAAFADTAEP